MRLSAILVVSFALGCSGGEAASGGESSPEASEAEPGEATEAAPSEPSAPEAGGAEATEVAEASEGTEAASEASAAAPDGDLCARARACCRAYVGAIPSARRPLEERGCAEMDTVLEAAGEASADVCEAAIGGWRQSLQLTGVEVPPDCR